MPSPLLRYRLLLTALSPALALLTLWQAWQVRSRRFAQQRLGYAYDITHTAAPLWLHCASVGEVRAALPLIEQLRSDPRFAPVIVSTATPTGADTVKQQGWEDVQHVYLPIDYPSAVRRAYAAIKPRALLLMETEIWPQLINTAARQQVPVIIVNGRLSPRTLHAPQWLLPVYQQALSKVSAVLAKSKKDAQGFEQLGAIPDKITALGNLKFAAITSQPKESLNPVDRPFWLAASTHDDEEIQLCTALLARPTRAKQLLVIAPRHPKRSPKIQEQLKALGIPFAVRSQQQPILADTRVYLADTLGEMPLWLQHAQAVFMGGSLIPVGGHNLLEPAAAGVPIISGPSLYNFLEESELLRSVGALRPAETAEEVLQYIDALLADPDTSQRIGAAGRQAVLANADILERYTEALLALIPAQQ